MRSPRVPCVFFVPISLQAKQTSGTQYKHRASKRFDHHSLSLPGCKRRFSTPHPASHPGPSLTTEYTPRERGAPAKPPAAQPPPTSAPASKPLATPPLTVPLTAPVSAVLDGKTSAEDGPDPSKFPPVTAPPSHPAIDPTATGMLEGRPVFEVDMAALADKAWRRPGSDISDWFNYGFDEISWEAYCYRRRELGDLAAVLKTNVVVRIFLYQNII